jgi:hypothetical protein
MPVVRKVFSTMTCDLAALRFVRVCDRDLLEEVAELGERYPHPHSILGTAGARDYVLRLRGPHNRLQVVSRIEGWFAATLAGHVKAACNLGLYGVGDCTSHSLWKIRHPMVSNDTAVPVLAALLNRVGTSALEERPGSVKLVLFVTEQEREAAMAAELAGFAQEGAFSDYYRPGETCLVYGRTFR